jgi:hypothetical protein
LAGACPNEAGFRTRCLGASSILSESGQLSDSIPRIQPHPVRTRTAFGLVSPGAAPFCPNQDGFRTQSHGASSDLSESGRLSDSIPRGQLRPVRIRTAFGLVAPGLAPFCPNQDGFRTRSHGASSILSEYGRLSDSIPRGQLHSVRIRTAFGLVAPGPAPFCPNQDGFRTRCPGSSSDLSESGRLSDSIPWGQLHPVRIRPAFGLDPTDPAPSCPNTDCFRTRCPRSSSILSESGLLSNSAPRFQNIL